MKPSDIKYNRKNQPKTFRLPPKIWKFFAKEAKENNQTLTQRIQCELTELYLILTGKD